MLSSHQQKKIIYSTAFSEVYEGVVDLSTKQKINIMTLKVPKITVELKNHLDNEILFLHSHKHPNLAKYKDFHFSADSCYFILENSNDCLINSYIAQKGAFSENEALSFLFSIIQVYELFKKENMPIRDFSFDNILIDSGEIKLRDLGLNYAFKLDEINQSVLNYSKPPEIFFEGKFLTNISEVWSLGIIFFFMLYGNLPWRGKTEAGFFNAVKDIPLKISKEKKQLKNSTIELLFRMLSFDSKKRMQWNELLNHEVFNNLSQKEDLKKSLLEPAENKWKFNIFSFYCKNDFILKNSFIDEKKQEQIEKKTVNYPSLEENVKSIAECPNYQLRMSANSQKLENQRKNDEQFKEMEEKRIIEIDKIIQRIMDNDKMNCSLKQNSLYINKNANISSSFIKKVEAINYHQSLYLGKSIIKSLDKNVNLENFYDEYIANLNNQLEKYNVFGKTIGDFELVFRKIVDLELWRIQRFLLLKKLIKFRLAFYEAFNTKENLMNLQFWEEFIKTDKFSNFMNKLKSENVSLQKDLLKLFSKTAKSLKKFEINEKNKIEKFLNLDLTQNFDNLFFICLYLHIKTINPKIEVSLKYNDLDRAVKMLMHKAEIADCLIINELEFLVDIPEYFNLKEFNTIINSSNFDSLKNYVDKKEKILEMWKPKYIY